MTLRSTLFLLLFGAVGAHAQQRFTTQILVVPAFRGTERGLAARATDVVRGRVADAFPRSELRVVSAGDVDDWLRRSGFEENAVLSEVELRELAKKFRADERITGVASRAAGRVRVDAWLTLVRDLRLTQPIRAEGATVNEAAEAVAKEAVSARKQFVPLRQCENALREGKTADAVAAATAGVHAYRQAVPARLCLINALVRQGVAAESLVAVTQAVLAVAPDNAIALENLALALDAQGKPREAAPVWVRFLATDSTNADLIERVVNALSRGGSTAVARPIIDRGSDLHADNLILLKLKWLVHLAVNDWKGAAEAGERLLARDPATQVDAEFHARLANAYRADSQPARALGVAAQAVAKFPSNAPLYLVYLQLLRAENDAALPRGLATFPENAELHVLAAQSMKGAGNAAGALAATKRALAANPRLPRGYLQLAQLELEVGNVDSAYVALELAPKHGEDPATVAQFALARGNAMYKSAGTSQKREDFQRAMRFLALATRLAPTAESRFLLGASALSISQSAATEAPATKSCDLSKLADSNLTEAEINLVGGGSAAPEAAKQYLDYVAKLRPYVADQIKSFC
jgi:tetratricopeptide (TPR) repeat protein